MANTLSDHDQDWEGKTQARTKIAERLARKDEDEATQHPPKPTASATQAEANPKKGEEAAPKETAESTAPRYL